MTEQAQWPTKDLTCYETKKILREETAFQGFFLTFDMDQEGKIRRHHWKECLQINKIGDTLIQAKIYLREAAKIYKRLYGGGGGGGQVCAPPPIQASVKFHDFEELYLR